MHFDIHTVLADMGSAVKETVAENWKETKSVTIQFLQNRKERIALLAQLRISGELSKEKFTSRLEDEKLLLEAELNALQVISKAIAQNAANSAINVLEKAVFKAISSAI
jgi:transcription termination factor Rho